MAGACAAFSLTALLSQEHRRVKGLKIKHWLFQSKTQMKAIACTCTQTKTRELMSSHMHTQALLRFKNLEHVCARSLEPRPYECFADVNPCSLRSLSLGGCCPSGVYLCADKVYTARYYMSALMSAPAAYALSLGGCCPFAFLTSFSTTSVLQMRTPAAFALSVWVGAAPQVCLIFLHHSTI